jgi:hypothetical protein
MTDFFTEAERHELLLKMVDLSNVGIRIKDRDGGRDLCYNSELTDRQAFFGKAKMWKVVQGVVEALFLEKLIAGELNFRKTDHEVKVREKRLPR